MAINFNGTTFSAKQTTNNLVNFNGTSMCTVVDSQNKQVVYDCQSVTPAASGWICAEPDGKFWDTLGYMCGAPTNYVEDYVIWIYHDGRWDFLVCYCDCPYKDPYSYRERCPVDSCMYGVLRTWSVTTCMISGSCSTYALCANLGHAYNYTSTDFPNCIGCVNLCTTPISPNVTIEIPICACGYTGITIPSYACVPMYCDITTTVCIPSGSTSVKQTFPNVCYCSSNIYCQRVFERRIKMNTTRKCIMIPTPYSSKAFDCYQVGVNYVCTFPGRIGFFSYGRSSYCELPAGSYCIRILPQGVGCNDLNNAANFATTTGTIAFPYGASPRWWGQDANNYNCVHEWVTYAAMYTLYRTYCSTRTRGDYWNNRAACATVYRCGVSGCTATNSTCTNISV